MSESDSSTQGAPLVLLVVLAFLCSGVPALLICGGMGASLMDVLRNLGAA